MQHIDWFQDLGQTLTTSDGKPVRILEFIHQSDKTILEEWARHFRNHYILDEELENSSKPTGLSKSDYLKKFKFPDNTAQGSSVRSGDFSEILIADYIEFILKYIVPRTRYNNKPTRNTSQKGVDIISFKLLGVKENPEDELLTCEVKGTLVTQNTGAYQKAIDDSKKDYLTRTPEALNAMRQRLKEKNEIDLVQMIDRFQNKTDHPYKEITAAALVASNHAWDDAYITSANATHPNGNLILFVIRGEKLMELANSLYDIANATA